MSQGHVPGGVRLLTPAELDALLDEMQRDGEWAREELARCRAATNATAKAVLEDDENADAC